MTIPGHRPGWRRILTLCSAALAFLVVGSGAVGGAAGASKTKTSTSVTYVGVAGGAISFGIDPGPDRLQRQHPRGRHSGHADGPGRRAAQPVRGQRQRGIDAQPERDRAGRGRQRPPEARDDRVHAESESGLVRRRPDHGQGLHLRLGAATGRPHVRSGPGGQHRRLQGHQVGEREQQGQDGHRDLPPTVRRLADAVRQSAAGPHYGEGGMEPVVLHRQLVDRPLRWPFPHRQGLGPGHRPEEEPEVVGNATECTEHHGAYRLGYRAAVQLGAQRLRRRWPSPTR